LIQLAALAFRAWLAFGQPFDFVIAALVDRLFAFVLGLFGVRARAFGFRFGFVGQRLWYDVFVFLRTRHNARQLAQFA
jgi:hypothetical protein